MSNRNTAKIDTSSVKVTSYIEDMTGIVCRNLDCEEFICQSTNKYFLFADCIGEEEIEINESNIDEYKEKIVAYFEVDSEAKELTTVHVFDDYRNKGYGRKILEICVNELGVEAIISAPDTAVYWLKVADSLGLDISYDTEILSYIQEDEESEYILIISIHNAA